MVTAGAFGPVAVWAAIAFALIAVATGRRWANLISAGAAAASASVLVVALLSGDFSLAYVAETTSLATPWPYRLAGLWGGMDGSMLFYSAMLLVIGAIWLRETAPIRVGAAVGLGLLLITMLFANPFTVLDIPAVDGQGLLAILQHPAMVYHPPILYLGLTVLVLPFAVTLGAVWRRTDRRIWMAEVRRWLFVSWVLLTFGMAAGANWAYVELGWGGYWAWDPVENTALMPWMATTVFLHTSRIEETTGRWRRWNVAFASLPFALTVMGIYLTRSGVTGSIHSFAEDPMVGRILLAAAVVIGVIVAVASTRSQPGEPWGPLHLDRGGWLAVNALLLTTALVFVTAGSGYPAFASVFLGEAVAVDTRFFVITVLPVAVAVAVGLSLALRGAAMAYVLVTVFLAALSVVMVGLEVGVLLMAPAMATLVFVAFGIWGQRPRGRLLTAHLAHLGMGLFLVGVAGSAFGGDFTGSMIPGETVEVAGREITMVGVDTGEGDRYLFVRADFSVDGEALAPEIRAYEDQTLPVAEPALRSTPGGDVIVAISLLFPDGDTVGVSVFVRPLVWLVWVGAIVIGLAGLVGLFSRGGAGAALHRSATAGPQREETTSETASR